MQFLLFHNSSVGHPADPSQSSHTLAELQNHTLICRELCLQMYGRMICQDLSGVSLVAIGLSPIVSGSWKLSEKIISHLLLRSSSSEERAKAAEVKINV